MVHLWFAAPSSYPAPCWWTRSSCWTGPTPLAGNVWCGRSGSPAWGGRQQQQAPREGRASSYTTWLNRGGVGGSRKRGQSQICPLTLLREHCCCHLAVFLCSDSFPFSSIIMKQESGPVLLLQVGTGSIRAKREAEACGQSKVFLFSYINNNSRVSADFCTFSCERLNWINPP